MFKQLTIPDFIDHDGSKIEYLTMIDGVTIKVNPKTIIIGDINIILDYEKELDPITNIGYLRAGNNTIVLIPLDTWEGLNRV